MQTETLDCHFSTASGAALFRPGQRSALRCVWYQAPLVTMRAGLVPGSTGYNARLYVTKLFKCNVVALKCNVVALKCNVVALKCDVVAFKCNVAPQFLDLLIAL